MYKVFINNKPLVIASSTEAEPLFEQNFILYGDDFVQFLMCVNLLESVKQPLAIVLVVTDVDEAWSVFCSHFKWIDAAGGVVKNPNGEILLIERLEKWDLPKGKVEKGETLDSAAVREIEEETGLQNIFLKGKITDTYHTYILNDERILKRTAWYSASVSSAQELVPQAEEHISKAIWANKNFVENVALKNTYLSIAEVLNLL